MGKKLTINDLRVKYPNLVIEDNFIIDSRRHRCVKCECPLCRKYMYVDVNSLNNGWRSCKDCYNTTRKRVINDKRLEDSRKSFTNKANKIHNNKYDYSKVNYVDSNTKVEITCPKHGSFWQRPSSHLQGYGCRECGKIKCLESRDKQTIDDVIRKFRKIHKDKYDYSKFIFKNTMTKSIIICPIHGEFLQRPNSHLQGQGCPLCRESKGEVIIRSYLERHSIFFESQKRFKDCKDKKPLPFDFYLPDYNICIEYNGIQHYRKDKQFLNKEDQFSYRLKHDQIKYSFCKNCNIKLLVIPYTEKDIDLFLDEHLL